MRISEISVTLEPSLLEKNNGATPRTLHRLANKKWIVAIAVDDYGMYPHEIRLINMIQELIIKTFNAADDQKNG